MKKLDWQKGQSLFELVVAIAISALIVVVIVSLTTNSIHNSLFSKDSDLATTYAQQLSEWLRGRRDNDIDTLETNAQIPTWCFMDLTWTKQGSCFSDNYVTGTGLFIRQGTFSIDDSSGKTIIHVDIDVSWTDSQGRHDVRNSTELSDWRQR